MLQICLDVTHLCIFGRSFHHAIDEASSLSYGALQYEGKCR